MKDRQKWSTWSKKIIPGQNKKFCAEPGRLSKTKAYLLPTLLRNIRYPLYSHITVFWESLRRIKKFEKMSSIRRGEIVYLEWLGGITLGSDMTKDLFLPCFSFSRFRLYSMWYCVFLFRSSCWQIFFKNGFRKSVGEFIGKQCWSLSFRLATLL